MKKIDKDKQVYKEKKSLITKFEIKKFLTIIVTYGLVIGTVGYIFGSVFLANALIMKLVYLSAAYKVFQVGREYIKNIHEVTNEYFSKLNSGEISVTIEDILEEELNKAQYVDSKDVSKDIDNIFNEMSREDKIAFLNRQKEILNDYQDTNKSYQKSL